MRIGDELKLLVTSLVIGALAFAGSGAFRDLLDAILLAVLPASERSMQQGWQLITYRLIYFLIVCALLVCLVLIFSACASSDGADAACCAKAKKCAKSKHAASASVPCGGGATPARRCC